MKSKNAAGIAARMGYGNVYWYKDGLAGWKEAGRPVIRASRFDAKPGTAITPGELNRRLGAGERLLVIDIRSEKAIRKWGTIARDSFHYPLYRFHMLYLELPRDKNLVLVDILGMQAPFASKYLVSKGFDPDKVYWLEGGVNNWKNSGLPFMEQSR